MIGLIIFSIFTTLIWLGICFVWYGLCSYSSPRYRDGSVVWLMFFSILLGCFIGAVNMTGIRINPIIAECEKSLPRDRHCVLTAVVEPVKEKE